MNKISGLGRPVKLAVIANAKDLHGQGGLNSDAHFTAMLGMFNSQGIEVITSWGELPGDDIATYNRQIYHADLFLVVGSKECAIDEMVAFQAALETADRNKHLTFVNRRPFSRDNWVPDGIPNRKWLSSLDERARMSAWEEVYKDISAKCQGLETAPYQSVSGLGGQSVASSTSSFAAAIGRDTSPQPVKPVVEIANDILMGLIPIAEAGFPFAEIMNISVLSDYDGNKYSTPELFFLTANDLVQRGQFDLLPDLFIGNTREVVRELIKNISLRVVEKNRGEEYGRSSAYLVLEAYWDGTEVGYKGNDLHLSLLKTKTESARNEQRVKQDAEALQADGLKLFQAKNELTEIKAEFYRKVGEANTIRRPGRAVNQVVSVDFSIDRKHFAEAAFNRNVKANLHFYVTNNPEEYLAYAALEFYRYLLEEKIDKNAISFELVDTAAPGRKSLYALRMWVDLHYSPSVGSLSPVAEVLPPSRPVPKIQRQIAVVVNKGIDSRILDKVLESFGNRASQDNWELLCYELSSDGKINVYDRNMSPRGTAHIDELIDKTAVRVVIPVISEGMLTHGNTLIQVVQANSETNIVAPLLLEAAGTPNYLNRVSFLNRKGQVTTPLKSSGDRATALVEMSTILGRLIDNLKSYTTK
ncbi:hypothetical protein A3J90_06095 [candidate division WOR-1 bacterium RIFOXYC2_FULL_37_10]|nr:MAG: hypothetical protein A3J90_06095 [candidate division WOR-1 bacterium RIFOXYC2_FULL_37_10]